MVRDDALARGRGGRGGPGGGAVARGALPRAGGGAGGGGGAAGTPGGRGGGAADAAGAPARPSSGLSACFFFPATSRSRLGEGFSSALLASLPSLARFFCTDRESLSLSSGTPSPS